MAHATIAIRAATVDDSGRLAVHRVAMFRDMGLLHPALESAFLDAAAAYFAAAMLTGEYTGWIAHASSDGAIVGGAGVQRRALLPRPGPDGGSLLLGLEGVVLNVYVEQAWRRRGVARRLMETILAWAPTAGVVRLVLHPSAEGRQLYESMGFVPTQELRFDGPLAESGPVSGRPPRSNASGATVAVADILHPRGS